MLTEEVIRTVLLDGYVTDGHERKTVNGKEVEITTYQGEHSDEYLLREVKEGQCQLFYKGIIRLSWREKDGVRIGGCTMYQNGIATQIVLFEGLSGKEHRYIVNGESSMELVIEVGESNKVVYRGGFDSVDLMKREGRGMEFDETSGRVLRCGVWKNDELFQITQECESEDVMIEYEIEDGKSNVSLLNRHPVYRGGYVFDEEKRAVLRNGEGYELSTESGFCERRGEWRNGTLEKVKLLHQGWYTRGVNDHSLRSVLIDSYVVVVHNAQEWESLKTCVTELTIAPYSCNDETITLFDVSGMSGMRSVDIGHECFMHVEKTKFIGLNKLERVTIGKNCFTEKKNTYSENPRRAFFLKDCARVRELRIGEYSFSDYSVCEIENDPALERIEMGDLNVLHCSCSFFNSSLELRSVYSP